MVPYFVLEIIYTNDEQIGYHIEVNLTLSWTNVFKMEEYCEYLLGRK